jgi:hypothetical protein
MKSKIIILAVALMIGIAFSSCKKDSQDNTVSSASSVLSFKMEALNKTVSLPVQESGLKSGSSSTATVVWDTARMLVSRIKFEAEMESILTGRDSLEIEYSWRGPQTVDLFDLTSILGTITLPAGTYEKVSLKIQSEREDANGQPLFYLSGAYTNDSGTTLPIVISVSDPVMFKTQQSNDSIVAGNFTDFTSTILLYLDQLLLNVNVSLLDNATLTNGTLLISANSNTEIYKLIMHNLRKDHGCKHEHHNHGHNH